MHSILDNFKLELPILRFYSMKPCVLPFSSENILAKIWSSSLLIGVLFLQNIRYETVSEQGCGIKGRKLMNVAGHINTYILGIVHWWVRFRVDQRSNLTNRVCIHVFALGAS